MEYSVRADHVNDKGNIVCWCAIQKVRLLGPDNLNVVARGCATECHDGEMYEGPFTATRYQLLGK